MTRPPFLRPGVRAHLGAALRLAWMAVRHLGVAIRVALGHLLASVVAGWRPLAALLGQLARLRPFAWLETVIRGLPPYGALAVFALPSLLLLPLKLLAIYLVAQGYKVAAATLFIGAKVVGTALVARIYMLTQTALMRIGWFKRAYDVIIPMKAALTEWVRESAVWKYSRAMKYRVKAAAAPMVARVKATVAALRIKLFGTR
jgi:hypothetical protein